MRETKPLSTPCPKCEQANVTCKFNHFHQGDLEIHSWEHKCLDCGWRATTAYRSDDEDLDTPIDQRGVCPYCSRTPENPTD